MSCAKPCPRIRSLRKIKLFGHAERKRCCPLLTAGLIVRYLMALTRWPRNSPTAKEVECAYSRLVKELHGANLRFY